MRLPNQMLNLSRIFDEFFELSNLVDLDVPFQSSYDWAR